MILLDLDARPVIAHRGDRAHAPENTLLAFSRAIDAGADAIECDVRVTREGEVVVIHDDTVDRTTSGTGSVTALSLADLQVFDAGARWSPSADPDLANGGVRNGSTPFRGLGARIPALREVLLAFPGVPFILDIKTVETAAPCVAVVRACGAAARVVAGAFDTNALAAPRAAGIATTASMQEVVRLLPAAVFGGSPRRGAPYAAIVMSPTRWGLPVPVAAIARVAGVPVHVWGAGSSAQAAELWARGVCGIIADSVSAAIAGRPHR